MREPSWKTCHSLPLMPTRGRLRVIRKVKLKSKICFPAVGNDQWVGSGISAMTPLLQHFTVYIRLSSLRSFAPPKASSPGGFQTWGVCGSLCLVGCSVCPHVGVAGEGREANSPAQAVQSSSSRCSTPSLPIATPFWNSGPEIIISRTFFTNLVEINLVFQNRGSTSMSGVALPHFSWEESQEGLQWAGRERVFSLPHWEGREGRQLGWNPQWALCKCCPF